VIRNAKRLFLAASQSWSEVGQTPNLQLNAIKSWISAMRICHEGLKSEGAGILGATFIVMVALARSVINLGPFHFMPWKVYKEGGFSYVCINLYYDRHCSSLGRCVGSVG